MHAWAPFQGHPLWVRIKGVNPVFHRITKCVLSFHIHKETHLLIFFLLLWSSPFDLFHCPPFLFFIPLCSPLCTDVKFSTYSPLLGFLLVFAPLLHCEIFETGPILLAFHIQ